MFLGKLGESLRSLVEWRFADVAKNEALERVMKLEVALIFLLNSLRGKGAVPDQTLDMIEKIVTSGGAQSA